MGSFKLGIKVQLALAVGFLSLTLIVVFGKSVYQMQDAASNFNEYADIVTDLEESATLLSLFLEMQEVALSYIKSSSVEEKERFDAIQAEMIEVTDFLDEVLVVEDQRIMLEEVIADMEIFFQAFADITRKVEKRNDLVFNSLDAIGPQARKKLDEIMESANKDGDVVAAYTAGEALQSLLLARLYVKNFLEHNSQEQVDRVAKEFQNLNGWLSTLNRELQNGQRRALLRSARNMVPEYQKNFETLVTTIFERNKIFEDTFLPVGDRLFANIEDITEDLYGDENVLSTEVLADMSWATQFQMISGAVLFIALFLAILTIVKFNRALNKLSENFSTQVNQVVTDLGSTAGDLDNETMSVSANAEQSIQHSGKVDNSSKELSERIGAVAAASNEMSASVREIAGSIHGIANDTNTVSDSATKTQEQIGQLGDALSNIDQILTLISEIAEQTNLLSLNAAIEAARAGDAGRGFSVVAEEVKKLSVETTNATNQIAKQMDELQQIAQSSIDNVLGIITQIRTISDNTMSISSAAEEQSKATDEISGNITESANLTESVQQMAEELSTQSQTTGESAQDMASGMEKLKTQSATLKQATTGFLDDLRNL